MGWSMDKSILFLFLLGCVYWFIAFNDLSFNDQTFDSSPDFTIVVVNSNNDKFYLKTHKDTLIKKSEYFKELFSQVRDNRYLTNITFYDDSFDTFVYLNNIFMYGSFETTVPIELLPKITQYMDKFKVLDGCRTYLDKTYANSIRVAHVNTMDSIITGVYPIVKKYNLVSAQNTVLNKIYNQWRNYPSFNTTCVKNNPELFHDYVRFLNC